jgi:hypothetical protein
MLVTCMDISLCFILFSLTYCIYEGRRSLCIFVIVLEKSWREQEARVCDVNLRRMHEEERDALDILGEVSLVGVLFLRSSQNCNNLHKFTKTQRKNYQVEVS